VTEHGFDQLVGVAIDPEGGHVYFTDRNARRVHRVGLELPAGETAETRTDLETLYQTGAGTMPIDLALDLDARVLYLTDRGVGVVKRMGMELPAGESAETRTDVETLVDGLSDPIGVAIAPHDDALYFTELTGAIHRARLDGSGDEVIANGGAATGIALSVLEDPTRPLECE
jgi:sugar lactone lactonase YvrE